MLNYVNSFSLSTSEDKTRVVLHLMQDYPLSTSEGDNSFEHELISSIIFDSETALALSSAIVDRLDPENDSDNDIDSSAKK